MRVSFLVRQAKIHGHALPLKIPARPLLVPARGVYKEIKWDTLASYDFALCFENARFKGWLTEKLFDCLHTGHDPDLWGATNIAELVPPDCFIDMRWFADYSELLPRLKASTGKPSVAIERQGVRSSVRQGALASVFKNMLEQGAGLRIMI